MHSSVPNSLHQPKYIFFILRMLLDILRACVSVGACVSHPWARSCSCKCVDPRISCPRVSLDFRLWRKRVSYLLSPDVSTFLLDHIWTLQESRSLSWSWIYRIERTRAKNRFEKYRKLFALGVYIYIWLSSQHRGDNCVPCNIIAFYARSTITRLPDKR